MIPARKNRFLDSLLYGYFRRMARGAFHTIAGRGLEHLRNLPDDRPVLLFCNHTSWWDGIAVILLTRLMPDKSCYCMMEEKQLVHFQFFTRLGAFSVDLESPRKAMASLRYTRRLLQDGKSAVWIFPQGKLCRPDEPIEARPGIDFLARKTPEALLVPVALRYEFFREDRPNMLIEIGKPFSAVELTEGRITRECSQAFTRISQAARDQDLAGFTKLFPPRWPINKRWEWIKRAATGRLKDFRVEN